MRGAAYRLIFKRIPTHQYQWIDKGCLLANYCLPALDSPREGYRLR